MITRTIRILIALLLVACGGPPFTAAPSIDGLVFGSSGGGEPATDDSGVPAKDAAGPPTITKDAGAPGDPPDSSGTDSGDFPDAGEDSADAKADVSQPPPADSGPPPCSVGHSDGEGQTWLDCNPIDTWTEEEATTACEAYESANGGALGACTDAYLGPVGVGGPPSTVEPPNSLGPAVCVMPSGDCTGYCWGYESGGHGGGAGGVYTCTGQSSANWQ